jgi:hypothetical protein
MNDRAATDGGGAVTFWERRSHNGSTEVAGFVVSRSVFCVGPAANAVNAQASPNRGGSFVEMQKVELWSWMRHVPAPL